MVGRFVLVVTKSLALSYSALKFATACIDKEYALQTIFFIQEGVNVASGLVDIPSDEPKIQIKWQSLAYKHHIELIVCATSALRRGVTEQHLVPGFKFGSISQMLTACDTAKHVIQL